MKILGVSFGGPNGANDSMCKEALMGAKEMGAEVEFVHLLDWNIKNCTGCVACSRALTSGKGNVCIQKDELDVFLDLILDADGIVFCTPIFEKGASGLFHTLNDRLGPRMDRGINAFATELAEKTGGKKPDPRILKDKVVSFIGIGGSNWSTKVQNDCAMLALPAGWKIIDNVVFSWSKNIILDPEKVKVVHNIGVELAKAAADYNNAKYVGEPGVCSHCHSRNFYLDPESTHAICCLCGIEGDMVIKNGKITFEFPEEQLAHAHDTMSGKFIHARDIQMNEVKNIENRKSDEYKNKVEAYKAFIQPILPSHKR
jgi:multimeric flavodoxin WrbA